MSLRNEVLSTHVGFLQPPIKEMEICTERPVKLEGTKIKVCPCVCVCGPLCVLF